MSTIVQVIPSVLNVGKKETVVVVFPVELPRNSLITLDITYSKRSSWSCWVPAQPLGPTCLHANFPELPHPGELDIFVKVQREAFSPVPKFRLRVQSPVEAIYRSLPPSQPHDTTALACITAYLMQNTEKDMDTLSHIDITMCNILKSLPSLTEWNVGNMICGKYGQQETLLHMCIRHRLGGAASQLVQSTTKCKGAFLQQQDHNGKTAAQIARKKGEKRIAEMVEKAIIVEHEETQVGAGGSLARKASMPSNYSHKHSLQASEDVGPLPLQIKGGKNLKHMLGKLKGKAKASKGVKDKKPPTNGTPPLIPHSQVTTEQHAAVHDPAVVEELETITEPLYQLLSRTMYKASVTCDYHWDNSPFRDQFSLEKGDLVYVIKEIGEDLCQGVCRNYYCMIPKHILRVITDEETDVYEEMLAEEEYDTVDAYYEHPAVEQTGSDLQIEPPPALPPREDPDIKPVGVKPLIVRGPLKTKHSLPIPGRLLSCSHSSSHDTGLDRLGLPRQVSKGKLPGSDVPGATTTFITRQAEALRVPYEDRTQKLAQNTAVTHSPEKKLSPLPTEPLEEYDDAMTIRQIALQKQQQVLDEQDSSVSLQVKRHPQTSNFDTSSNEKLLPIPKPRSFTSPSKFQRPTVIPAKDPEQLKTETPSKTKATNVLELTKRFERK